MDRARDGAGDDHLAGFAHEPFPTCPSLSIALRAAERNIAHARVQTASRAPKRRIGCGSSRAVSELGATCGHAMLPKRPHQGTPAGPTEDRGTVVEIMNEVGSTYSDRLGGGSRKRSGGRVEDFGDKLNGSPIFDRRPPLVGWADNPEVSLPVRDEAAASEPTRPATRSSNGCREIRIYCLWTAAKVRS
jgi:hypothetical protein